MKKIYLSLLLLFLFIIPLVNAQLGTFKQNDCVTIKTITNATSANISTISYPNGGIAVNNTEMSKVGSSFTYVFCNTSQIGYYVYDYTDSEGYYYVNNFEISPSGFTGTLGFYIILLVVLALVITLGFSIKEGWFVVIGGMGLIILGLYSINNGIAGFRDMFMTWAISLFLIGTGTFLAIKSTLEMMDVEVA